MTVFIVFFVMDFPFSPPFSPSDPNKDNAQSVNADPISPKQERKRTCSSSSLQRSFIKCKQFSICQCPLDDWTHVDLSSGKTE